MKTLLLSLFLSFFAFVATAQPPITGTFTVCVGSTTTLANSASGGTWSSSNIAVGTISTGGVLTGLSAGVTTVTYTHGGTTTQAVTVNPLPAAISGPSSMCVGNAGTVTDASGGGTWTSSAISVATVGSSSGALSAVSSGTTTVVYTLPTTCATSYVLTVNPAAGPISGSSSISTVGSTTTLSATPPGGTWTSNNTAVAAIGSSSGIVVGNAYGVATMTYSLSTGCYATYSVTVGPVVAIFYSSAGGATGPVVCAGSTTTVSATPSGGTWSSSNSSIASIGSTTGLITGVAAGTATLTYSYSGSTGTVGVTVNPAPAAISGPSAMCIGDATTLTNASGGGTWSSSSPSVASVGSASGAITALSAGTTSISYTLPTGCASGYVLTVNTTPGPITGPNTVGLGSTITLSSPPSGGTWTSSSTSNATVGSSSGVVTGVSSGIVDISYTLPGGCSARYSVTVTPLVATIVISYATSTGGSAPMVCVGSTMTVSATPSGGVWTSSSNATATVGSTSGIVTGVSTGTVVMTYTISPGVFGTINIIVNPNPVISGPNNVCAGSSINLTGSPSGGVWSSGSPGVATVGSGTGTVTGVTAGTAVITYMLSTGCFDVYTVTVNRNPGPIIGVPGTIGISVCVGNSLTLTNAVSGGVWTSGNTSVVTIGSSSGIATGVTPGVTTITYTLPTGCFVTAPITVNPSPAAISGPSVVCTGSSINLTSSGGGVWSAGPAAVATIGSASGTLTGLSAGVATVTYMLPTGCYVTTTITVNPTPVIGASTGTHVCVGSTLALSSSPTGGVWTSANTLIATVGSSSGIITGVSAGTVTIVYTLSTGCSASIVITVDPMPAPISGPNTVCVGSTVNLTSSPSGGTWSSGAPGTATVSGTGVVTGISPGVATITYSLATGCFVTMDVTVNPVPVIAVGATGVPGASICTGNTTTLSATPAGGIWTSSNTSVATVGSISGVVTGVAPGIVTIVYTLPTGCSASVPVTVNLSPTTITGPSAVCVGNTATLTSSPSGGTWTSGAPGIATISGTGVVTGISPGVAPITYSLASGCFVTTNITVNPVPTITGGSAGVPGISVCAGSTVTLIGSPTGGTWTSSNVSIATVGSLSGIVTGLTPGVVFITYTLPTGCFAVVPVTVNPMPLPITGPSTVCVGNSITLTGSPSGGTWTSGSPGIGTITGTGVVTGISPGVTTITYTLPGGCFVTTDVTVNPQPTVITGTTGLPVSSLCVGDMITLTSNPLGGVWTSSNTSIATVGSASGTVTAVAPGVVTITYTLPTGCFTSITITVNPTPVITGLNTVCTGATINLTGSPTGGVWTSGAPAIAGVGSSSGVVAGITAGTAVITYMLPTGCFATTTITVNQTPSIGISTFLSICAGSTFPMPGAPGGGVWTSTNTSVATIGSLSGILVGVAPGVTTIIYSMPTGCSASMVVTVNPQPTVITGPTAVCVGGTIGLGSTPTGGTWTSGNTTIATIGSLSGVVTGVSPGIVNITYTLPAGCMVTTTITVNANPVIIATTPGPSVCVGGTVVLNATPSVGVWTSSNTTIATVGSATGVVTGVAPGVVVITFMLSTGCFTTTTVTVNAQPVITGPAVTCVGSTTNLTGTPSGGTWTSGSPGVAAVGSSSGIVTGLSVGTAVITYMMPSGCFATTVVTVNPTPRILGSTVGTTVCAGSTVTLTGTPTGGVWTSSNVTIATVGSSSGIVTTILPGTVVITYTLPTGCSASTVIVIVASPGVITGTMAMCVGSTSVLFCTPGGGTWSSGSPGVATINPSTGVVTGVSAGTATITYMLSSGCISTAVVTVNPNPVAIAGPTSVCAGSSITLTNSTAGGVWTSSNTSIATVGSSSGVVTGVAPGSATIMYTLSTGCSASVTIVVNPSPGPISGPSAMCVGSSVVFTGTGGGIWSSSNTSVATVGSVSGVVTAVSAGTVNITYMNSIGCYSVRPVTVNPQPGPISGPPYVCVGRSVTLSVTPPGGTWTSSNPLMGSVNPVTGVVTGIAAGTVTITYTLPGGCFSTFVLPVRPQPCFPAGINDVPTEAGTITLFPNPASDELVIKDEDRAFTSFTVTNSVGQILLQGKLTGKQTDISVKSLPGGMYYFNAAGDNGMSVIKFVKQ